jgi:hypothetical protein
MSDETCGTCLLVVIRGLVAVLPCPSGLPLFGMNSTRRSLSLAWVKGPVSCALMSGLLRDICRWPSWVYACVLGANLSGVLEAHDC